MDTDSRDLAHLAEANRHIAEAEQRAADLQDRIDKWSGSGRDVASAQELLVIIRGAIITMRAHRNAIRSALGYTSDAGND